MTIERDRNGDIMFVCDSCGDQCYGRSRDFRAAWPVAKACGWSTRKIAKQWLHSCAGCEPPR